MPSLEDYAALSNVVYNDVRGVKNQHPIPAGWTPVLNISNLGLTTELGFTASAYRNGSDIVIAYKGTDTKTFLDGAIDWLGGNIPGALGYGSPPVSLCRLVLRSGQIG